MSLNIKNPEAHRLAIELARQTGMSLTEAVTEALREKLERVATPRFNQKKYDALVRIAQDSASRMSHGTREIDINELLYDEMGMPK